MPRYTVRASSTMLFPVQFEFAHRVTRWLSALCAERIGVVSQQPSGDFEWKSAPV
nr:hypothetical protein [Nocardia brasiliensis]